MHEEFEDFGERVNYPQGEVFELAVQPRNLAGVVEVSKLLAPRKSRYTARHWIKLSYSIKNLWYLLPST
jgi:hypothetical protein